MQLKFGDAEGLGKRKQIRREIFLAEMERIVPWKQLLAPAESYYPLSGLPGWQPYALAMDVQPLAPQHGARRHHPSNEIGDGHVASDLANAQSGGAFPTQVLREQVLASLDIWVVDHLVIGGRSLRSGRQVECGLSVALLLGSAKRSS
ncbi:hypothetical protein J7396_14350 [Xanthomonas sp. A1809]|nr:hypothetical protein [Xanthomonas sp. A1809]